VPRRNKRRVWHVAEHRDAKSKRLTEGELRHKLRGNDLSGMELARVDESDAWLPLHELPIFAEEVPTQGDPRRVALRREGRSFLGHVGIWAGVLAVTGGYAEWWGWVWGAFVAYHAYRAVPHLFELWRSRAGRPPSAAALPETETPPELAAFTREAERVRELIEARGSGDREELLAAVDSIVSHVRELLGKESELALLTRDEAERTLDTETAELDEQRATLGGDDARGRALLEERYKMVESRRRALAQARRSLEDLRGRRRLAEDQVRLLRIELASLDAARTAAPDHRERLAAMRHQLGALQELDSALEEAATMSGSLELES
jgi:multidrug efflux pump subunit AcrA (membrane-fusion protein)